MVERSVALERQMREAYLDYAMSVIVSRALPDVRDGLKPVQRRVLYAMYDQGMRNNSPYRKSARVVGDVIAKYHPHGDSPVYEALVRLAQSFSLRYPLVDGQGNFGSVDNDPPAAMRYTEARLTSIAEEMIVDIDRQTVAFAENFDGSEREPVVLPARLPNLLVNGTAGIAVGMATNMPPHNLREVCDAILFALSRWQETPDGGDFGATLDELHEFIKGPDFPTAGIIRGTEGVRSAYATGLRPCDHRGPRRDPGHGEPWTTLADCHYRACPTKSTKPQWSRRWRTSSAANDLRASAKYAMSRTATACVS